MLLGLAFTARFGLVPLVEAVADVRAAGRGLRDAALEQRIATLELRLAELSTASRTQSRPRYTARLRHRPRPLPPD